MYNRTWGSTSAVQCNTTVLPGLKIRKLHTFEFILPSTIKIRPLSNLKLSMPESNPGLNLQNDLQFHSTTSAKISESTRICTVGPVFVCARGGFQQPFSILTDGMDGWMGWDGWVGKDLFLFCLLHKNYVVYDAYCFHSPQKPF